MDQRRTQQKLSFRQRFRQSYSAVALAGLFAAASFGQAPHGSLNNSTTIQAGTGAIPRSAEAKARETVTLTDFCPVPDGVASNQVCGQKALDHLHSVGGGVLIVPHEPNCFMAGGNDGLQFYSNITVEMQGCVMRLPNTANCSGPPGCASVFRNDSTQPASNVHFLGHGGYIDGNRANAMPAWVSGTTYAANDVVEGSDGNLYISFAGSNTGNDPVTMPPFTSAFWGEFDGGSFGFYCGGCSNSSLENLTIQNAATDDINIEGYGGQPGTAYSATANTANVALSLTSATNWTAAGGTVYTITGGTLTPGVLIQIAVTGSTPGGYNQNCVGYIVSPTTVQCGTPSSNPGAYGSGGTLTYYEATWQTGTNFDLFATNQFINIGSTQYGVDGRASATVIYLNIAPGTQTGANVTWTGVAGVGDGFTLLNVTATGSRRNNLSIEGGTNIVVQGGSYSAACGTAPEDGIDVEPYQYGSLLHGLTINADVGNNCNDGIQLQLKQTYDPALAPTLNVQAHDNGAAGLTVVNEGMMTTGTLTVDGNFNNNLGAAGYTVSGVTGPILRASSSGSARGLLLNAFVSNAQLAGASLCGTAEDLSVDGPFSNVAINAAALGCNGIQSGEELSVSQTMTMIPALAAENGVAYWPGSSPRTPAMSVTHHLTISEAVPNPYILLTDVLSVTPWSSTTAYVIGDTVFYGAGNYTAIANGTNEQPDISPAFWQLEIQVKLQSVTQSTGFVGTQTNDPMCMGSNNTCRLNISKTGDSVFTGNLAFLGSDALNSAVGSITCSGAQAVTAIALASSGTNTATLTPTCGSAAGGGITALTGDVTATGPGSAAATLATSGVSAATYGSTTTVPQIAVDAKGRITSASNQTIPLPLSGTSSSIGGSALAAGACSSGTVTIAGAATTMAVDVSPVTDPGDAFYPKANVSSANTVTVKVCATIAGTPGASAYNVRVNQ